MPRGIEAEYTRLNDYLIKNIDNDDISANMEAAFKLLKEQGNVKQSIFSRVPIEDLKQFANLRRVKSNPKCDDVDYKVLRDNEAAVGLYGLKEDEKVFRRIDKVVLKIFIDHAEKCLDVYDKRYISRIEEFDSSTLDRVEGLTGAIFDIDKLKIPDIQSPDNLFSKYIKSYPEMHLYQGEVLQNALKASGMNDPNIKYLGRVADGRTGKLIVHKEKIKRLVDEYLIEPCQEYVAAFGPDLFIPARFDARYSKVDSTKIDFYTGWSGFMICRSLCMNNAAVYNSIIKSADEAISSS